MIKLPKREINLDYTMSNSYNGADLTFLTGLRLSFSSIKNFLFSLVKTLQLSKDSESLQSNKLSLTVLLSLGLIFFSHWWDSDMLPNSYIKLSYSFTIHGRVHTEIYKRCHMYVLSEMPYLKRKSSAILFWLLKAICNLQQLRIHLRDFLKLTSSL